MGCVCANCDHHHCRVWLVCSPTDLVLCFASLLYPIILPFSFPFHSRLSSLVLCCYIPFTPNQTLFLNNPFSLPLPYPFFFGLVQRSQTLFHSCDAFIWKSRWVCLIISIVKRKKNGLNGFEVDFLLLYIIWVSSSSLSSVPTSLSMAKPFTSGYQTPDLFFKDA